MSINSKNKNIEVAYEVVFSGCEHRAVLTERQRMRPGTEFLCELIRRREHLKSVLKDWEKK
jgi:hypothetical protein